MAFSDLYATVQECDARADAMKICSRQHKTQLANEKAFVKFIAVAR